MNRIRVSRTTVDGIPNCPIEGVEALGASYTHIKSLSGIIGPNTKRIVMYHSYLEDLSGFEDTKGVDIANVYFSLDSIEYLNLDLLIPLYLKSMY